MINNYWFDLILFLYCARFSWYTENPFLRIFLFSIPTIENIKSVEVYDTTGKLVLKDTSGKNRISVSFLNKGLYVIKIATNHSAFTTKFSKK